MAAAFDQSSFFTIGGSGSGSHAPVGTPKGVAVLIVQDVSSADVVSAVTYGGVAMTRVATGVDTSGEPGRAYLYFLGSGIPTGSQNVSVTVSSGTDAKAVWVVTVTAGGNTESAAAGNAGENVANPAITLGTGAGFSGVVVAALFSGLGVITNVTAGSGYTKLDGSAAGGHDFGTSIAACEHGSKSGASVVADFVAASDDVAMVAMAIQEVAGASPQTVSPTGIASAEAFGTPKVNQQVRPAAIASAEALGAPRLALAVRPAGITSGEAFGSPRLNLQVRAAGKGSDEAFGVPLVSAGGGQTIAPTGIASALAFGTPRLNLQVRPAAIASAQAFGAPRLNLRIFPVGVTSAEAFGLLSLRYPQTISPAGIPSALAFGVPRLTVIVANLAPKAVTLVEIQWDPANITGWAMLNRTLLGDPLEPLAPSRYILQFNGPHDQLGGLTDQVQITRGRDNNVGPMQMGRATIDVRDPTAIYSPENPASPLVGKLVPRRLVRITSGGEVQFVGFVERCVWEPDGRRGMTRVEAVDLFVRLAEVFPIIPDTGPTTVGAAIGLVHDAAGWTDPALRSFDPGDQIPNFRAVGELNGLQQIEALLDVDRGVYFHGRAGVATYRSRHTIMALTSVGAITNEMRAIAPGVDASNVRNRARVTREGGVQQTAEDADSRYEHGYSDWPEITSTYLTNDDRALELAQHLVQIGKDPTGALYALPLRATTPQLLAQIIGRDLQQVITASEAVGGTSGEYLIEQIVLTIQAKRTHEATWILSKRPAVKPFRIGVSQVGGPDVIVY